MNLEKLLQGFEEEFLKVSNNRSSRGRMNLAGNLINSMKQHVGIFNTKATEDVKLRFQDVLNDAEIEYWSAKDEHDYKDRRNFVED